MIKRIFQSVFLLAAFSILLTALLSLVALTDYFAAPERAKSLRVTWIDPEGKVKMDSAANTEGMVNHLGREEVIEALKTGEGHSSRYSDTKMERQFYYAKKLEDGSVVRVSSSQRAVLSNVIHFLPELSLCLLLAFVLALVVAWYLAKRIFRPLEAMRREFTANVSHELKTPIQSIQGAAEMLEAGLIKPEDEKRFYALIRSEARRMSSLVGDILSLSRLDEGEAGLKKEEVDFSRMVRDVVASLKTSAEKAKVVIELDVPLEAPRLTLGYPQFLDALVFNLVDNAIKYNCEGGRVIVKLVYGDDFLRLSVSDTGVGIPKAHQERIFERFYRIDKSRSRALGGTGLGLAIVKHAAKLHDGEVSLSSELCHGSVFTITLPL